MIFVGRTSLLFLLNVEVVACLSTWGTSLLSTRAHHTFSPCKHRTNNNVIKQYHSESNPTFASLASSSLSLSSSSESGGPVHNESPLPTAPQRVVIVGGGVGGLAVASHIASSSSCEVILLEKNAYVGGRCGSFDITIPDIGTFRHERGPSLLLLPQVYRDIFRDCSQSVPEEYGLQMSQCIPAYQVVFEDGDRVNLGFPEKTAHFATKDSGSESSSSSSTTTRTRNRLQSESRAKMDSFEPNGAMKWDEYMKAMSAFLDCGLPNFIEERLDLFSFPRFLKEALRDFGKAWPLKPHSDVLDAIFESNKMKALASFQDLYVGLEPYRNDAQLAGGVIKSTAPAVFGLLSAIELHPSNRKSGVFAPIGGFRSVTSALENLAKDHGVTIQCNKVVTSVQSSGVYVSDSSSDSVADTELKTGSAIEHSNFIPADLILINADLPYAAKTLIGASASASASASGDDDHHVDSEKPQYSKNKSKIKHQPTYDWEDDFDFSSGVVAFHWAIDKKLKDLNTHNVFLVANSRSQAEKSWRVMRNEKRGGGQYGNDEKRQQQEAVVFEPMNFYVHCPSKTDPSAAPHGCDSMMVLVPCDTLWRVEAYSNLPRKLAINKYLEQFNDEFIMRLREDVLNRFASIESLQDLRDHIINEVVDTPGTYADKYNVAAGTPFGISHGLGQLSVTRPGPKYSNIPNVMYCGASSRPGNGVPLVLIGAKLVAKKAMDHIEQKRRRHVGNS